jgi:inner membrane protein
VDNLTHTLIGLVAGEAVARGTRARAGELPDPARRAALLGIGIIGGNLPDVDLLWSMRVFTGDAIDYLVDHRGHTHTLVGCMALALLLLLGTLAVLRWRGHRIRAPDAGLLGAMALLAVMLHLGMDALNEYGVHPFWPWNNRWYYGDAVFIVEPLYWLATAPLFFSLRTRVARALLGLVIAVGCIAVLAFHRFGVVWWVLPALALLLLFAGRRMSPRAASLAAVALLCAVTGAFSVAHAVVAQRVRELSTEQFPGAVTLDMVLSPAPAHPLCWEVMLLQREGGEYAARMGQLSLLPDESRSGSAEACARSIGGAGTAPLEAMQVPARRGMRWTRQFSMDATALARLADSNCDTRRIASFLRAPFATRTDRGWILGDLRFDREPEAGFAEILIERQDQGRCGAGSPWTAPRRDLGL